MSDQNLVWISAIDSGNKVPTSERVLKAVIAKVALEDQLDLDASRAFIGGFSGGAKVSTVVMKHYPKAYRGGVFIGGSYAWGDGSGDTDLDGLAMTNRYVFLTGRDDFNRKEILSHARGYRSKGAANVKVMDIGLSLIHI